MTACTICDRPENVAPFFRSSSGAAVCPGCDAAHLDGQLEQQIAESIQFMRAADKVVSVGVNPCGEISLNEEHVAESRKFLKGTRGSCIVDGIGI
jgi:hypothetical protein